MSKFTKKQSLFIESITPTILNTTKIDTESVDKAGLQELADLTGVGFPYWITRNTDYKVGRGLWRIAMDSESVSKPSKKTSSKKKVSEPVVDSTLSLAKGTVEKVSNVP